MARLNNRLMLLRMTFPIQVSFRNLAFSEAAESLCWQEASRLQSACERISNCRVFIEARRNGVPEHERIRVRVDVHLAGERVLTAEAVASETGDPVLSEMIHTAFDRALSRVREQYPEG